MHPRCALVQRFFVWFPSQRAALRGAACRLRSCARACCLPRECAARWLRSTIAAVGTACAELAAANHLPSLLRRSAARVACGVRVAAQRSRRRPRLHAGGARRAAAAADTRHRLRRLCVAPHRVRSERAAAAVARRRQGRQPRCRRRRRSTWRASSARCWRCGEPRRARARRRRAATCSARTCTVNTGACARPRAAALPAGRAPAPAPARAPPASPLTRLPHASPCLSLHRRRHRRRGIGVASAAGPAQPLLLLRHW
jgi:hypothetical protein